MLFDKFDASLYDNLMDGVLILDMNKGLVYANEAFSNMVEIPLKRLKIGKPFSEILTPKVDFWSPLSNVANEQISSTYREIIFTKVNQSEISAQTSVRSFQANGCSYWLIYLRDVTLEKKLQQKYRNEMEMKDVFIKELDRKLFEMQFLLKIASIQAAHSPDEPFLMEQVEKALRETFPALMVAYLTSSATAEGGELSLQTFSADPQYDSLSARELVHAFWRTLQITGNNIDKPGVQIIPTDDFDWTVIPLKGRANDFGVLLMMTESIQRATMQTYTHLLDNVANQIAMSMENSSLYLKSITDEMTKLFNHRYFKYTFNREIQRSERLEAKFSLLIVDIDHFKKVNDSYGHQTGDQVLKVVANVLKNSCRTTDIVARYGGEEFAVILVDTDRTGAVGVAERIRSQIEKKIVETEKHGPITVTASIGIAVYPHHGKDEFNMIEAADTALYEAKKKGRNRTVIRDWQNSNVFTVVKVDENPAKRRKAS